MQYKQFLLIVLIISSASMQLNAQNKQVIVQLKLESGSPAEKASVLLNSLETGGSKKALLTNGQGIISIEADSMRYILSAAFTGMESISDTILANGKTDTLRYTFRQHFTELATVQVNRPKKILEVKDDRFIYNVSADSSARSKSLSQVLHNLPFVTVDGSGNVRVAGQTSYKVLLNGKETALFVNSIAQVLRSYPAEIVSRIELITAPAARYDAEGVTAIINIITKKFAGYKGFNAASMNEQTYFSNGLTLTGRTGKLGITVNSQVNGNWNPLKGYRTTVTTPLLASAYEERRVSGEDATKRIAFSGTMELNYEIDSLHSLIGYITADKSATDNGLQQQVYTKLPGGNSEDGYIEMNSTDRSPGLMAGVDYTKKSKKNPARESSFRFNWKGTSNRIKNTTAQEYDVFSKWMKNNSEARNDEYTFQLDAIPVKRIKYSVEAGIKTILRQASADYTSLFTFDENSDYTKDDANSNSFNYRQQVYAAYGSISAKIKKNNLRAGVRLEQTSIEGRFSNLPSTVKDNYLSVIPNLYWNRKIGKATSASLAYNLNLLRPYITSLNPYVNNTDSFNISYGNPDLGPQQIHRLVAQVRYNDEKLVAFATLTGSFSDNKIFSYRLFDAATGITAITPGNVGREQLIGFGPSVNYQFTKKIRAGIWGELRYVDIRNRLEKQQHNYGYSGIVGTYLNWDVDKRFNLSYSGGMEVSNVTLLGRRNAVYFYQFNFGYHVVKDKLYATMHLNNLHSRYNTIRTTFKDDAVQSETIVKNLYRSVFVGIQYTFGKLRQEVARKKGVVNDDIIR